MKESPDFVNQWKLIFFERKFVGQNCSQKYILEYILTKTKKNAKKTAKKTAKSAK